MLLNRIVTRRHGDGRSHSRGRPNARVAEWRTRGLVVAAAIGLLLAMLPATAGLAADTGVYLYSTRGSSGITRANVDGTGANTSFLVPSGFAMDVAVNDQYLYWADYTGYKIGRANLDGTSPNPSFISTGSYPSGIAVNAQYTTGSSIRGRARTTPSPGRTSMGQASRPWSRPRISSSGASRSTRSTSTGRRSTTPRGRRSGGRTSTARASTGASSRA